MGRAPCRPALDVLVKTKTTKWDENIGWRETHVPWMHGRCAMDAWPMCHGCMADDWLATEVL